MDSDSVSTKIDKLNNNNYHAWKQKIMHLLALKDLDDFIYSDPPAQDSSQFISWTKKDRKASAIIALTLSDELLENVRGIQSTKEMWVSICNIFERHTLLNKLAARRKFYTATKRKASLYCNSPTASDISHQS